jgi:F1F0 ATPase subunit 2
MNDTTTILLQVAAGLSGGLLIGGLFFGGLWWTVQRLASSPQPALLAAGSLAVRLALLSVGLWAVTRLGLPALLAAGAGLLIARQWIVRQVRAGSAEAV